MTSGPMASPTGRSSGPPTASGTCRAGPTTSFGTSGDIPVAADYTGDGQTDIGLFRPSTGQWFWPDRDDFNLNDTDVLAFGTNGDIPVPGDYDGDGDAQIAVFRPSTGRWFLRNVTVPYVFGTNGDVPVPGDYNDDGRTEVAVFRPSDGRWYIHGQAGVVWGAAGDIPVPGDYDGDGDSDFAVFRPSDGKWYVKGGATTSVRAPRETSPSRRTSTATATPTSRRSARPTASGTRSEGPPWPSARPATSPCSSAPAPEHGSGHGEVGRLGREHGLGHQRHHAPGSGHRPAELDIDGLALGEWLGVGELRRGVARTGRPAEDLVFPVGVVDAEDQVRGVTGRLARAPAPTRAAPWR